MSTPSGPERFRLGVNYWPRRKAMYWWRDFARGEVADEFDVIADIGMDSVRVFLLWDDFQPTPDRVDEACLSHLDTVCDLAAERGLGLDVTFFTGHMSGPNWAPGWLREGATGMPTPWIRQVVSGGEVVPSAYRHPYEDPSAVAAAELLARTVVTRLRDHPGVWMWNLANEPDLFGIPSSNAAGTAWVAGLTDAIHALDPTRPVTCGLHSSNLFDNTGFRVDQVFGVTDVAVIHGYPMYVPWARDPLDVDFVPFMCALTTALCDKPTYAEEWGGCTTPNGDPSEVWEWECYGQPGRTQFMAGEEVFAAYVGEVLPRLVEVGSPGSLFWCFADYSEELWDRPPCEPGGARHERHFGLVRPDGSLKPHAEVIRKFAATRPTVQAATRTVELDVSSDEYYTDPNHHAQRLYEHFTAVAP